MKRVCVVAWLWLLACATVAAPFQNGSFEVGAPVPCASTFGLPAGASVGPGWTVSVGTIDWVCTNDFAASEGSYSLDLNGSTNIGGVEQTFDTIPGAAYFFSFRLAGNPGPIAGTPPIKPLTLTVGSEVRNYTYDVSGQLPETLQWIGNGFIFFAAGTSTTVRFVSDMSGTAGFAGAAIDDVGMQLVQVPPLALIGVVAQNSTQSVLVGRTDGVTSPTIMTFQLSTGASCAEVAARTNVSTVQVTTDEFGYFLSPLVNVPPGTFAALAYDAPTSPQFNCLVSSAANDIWPRALPVLGNSATLQDYIDAPGKARWYRFSVTPGQLVQATISGLPADYDLAIFKDIGQTFLSLLGITDSADLTRLSAEYAPSVFSPSVFSPSVFSPSVFSPDAYTPSVFSPSVFSPSVFSPSVFSPSVFSPSVFSPSVFSPSVFSPSVFSPSVFSPSVFSPSVFSPSVFSADELAQAFSSAQTRSLLGVSATAGTANELVLVNTWNNTGNFYVRVAGRSGAFSTAAPFTLNIVKGSTSCAGVTDTAPPQRGPADAANVRTLVVTDSSKVALGAQVAGGGTLQAKLDAFLARSEIGGVLRDVAGDTRVEALKLQARNNASCPFAKNLLAREIKAIIDSYRLNNPDLRYIVIAGNDDAIPFFRYPDQSLLGQESGYFPPVQSTSPSEASLRKDFVLGQDAYGSTSAVSLLSTVFPIPGLAVGRLVESPDEIAGVLDAYMSGTTLTPSGPVTLVPQKALVTGYDFLQDAADAVKFELHQGTNSAPDSLIAPNNLSPQDPAAWTATDLRTLLLNEPRYDVVFLAGHFSANSLLAADFATSIVTSELVGSTVNLANSVIFSAGCHSGYNLVDVDAIEGVTLKLDWAQAFAQKRATLIAGTGYQYGDTDFIEYSERLYHYFAQQLRTGAGPVAVGEALAKAKRDYLAAVPDIRGLHQKALLEATVFGLPMLSVNMPGTRLPVPPPPGVITPTLVSGVAGTDLGLKSHDLPPIMATLQSNQRTLVKVPVPPLPESPTVVATWLSGPDGVVTNPAEPALPLVKLDVTPNDANLVLRGVGFLGGSYADSNGLVPLTGAPTTELRGVHTPFLSPVFFPMRLATPNYFSALSGGGRMHLLVTPAQHRAYDVVAGTSTRRTLNGLQYRLYYSELTTAPALSDAPTIVSVDAEPNGPGSALFTVQVVGDPKAAIHDVWVTYTGGGGSMGQWVSLQLEQCVEPLPATCASEDSLLWSAQATSLPADTHYIVQAVNGVGLVSLDDNLGSYYRITTTTIAPSTLAFAGTVPGGATFGDVLPVTAMLSGSGTPLAGRAVTVSVGGGGKSGVTAADGSVTVQLPIIVTPGTYSLTAAFAGDASYLPSAASAAPFVVAKAPTTIVPAPSGTGVILTASIGTPPKSQPLNQETVRFTVQGPAGLQEMFAITDYTGFASVPPPGFPAGTYTILQAVFDGNATYAATSLFYQFGGFLEPVNNPPTVNIVKAGQSIPVKFSLGGFRGLDIFAQGYPVSRQIACSDVASADAIEETVSAGGSSLTYDPTLDRYTYVWKTSAAWANTCRELIIKFNDGTTTQRVAIFQFKK